MAENKTRPTEVSVNEFLKGLPEEGKRTDAKALVNLMGRLAGEKPKMWGSSIVGFGTIHYRYESGREGDVPIAAFSPRKSGIVIYGMNSFPEASELTNMLGKCKLEGSCLHIKRLADVDLKVLESMILKSIEAARHKQQG